MYYVAYNSGILGMFYH